MEGHLKVIETATERRREIISQIKQGLQDSTVSQERNQPYPHSQITEKETEQEMLVGTFSQNILYVDRAVRTRTLKIYYDKQQKRTKHAKDS